MIESWIKKTLWEKSVVTKFRALNLSQLLCHRNWKQLDTSRHKQNREGYNCSLGTKKIVNLKFVSLFFNQIFLFQKLLVLKIQIPVRYKRVDMQKLVRGFFCWMKVEMKPITFFLTANEFLIQVLYQIIENWNILISKNNRNKNTFETLFAGNSSFWTANLFCGKDSKFQSDHDNGSAGFC